MMNQKNVLRITSMLNDLSPISKDMMQHWIVMSAALNDYQAIINTLSQAEQKSFKMWQAWLNILPEMAKDELIV